MYEEFVQLSSKKQTNKHNNNSIKKWARDLNRLFFFKEDIQMVNR